MSSRSDHFRRGTTAYNEVLKILGPQCHDVLDESVRQVSYRWLKGTFIVRDERGYPKVVGGITGSHTLLTRRRRIRIPRTLPLAKVKA